MESPDGILSLCCFPAQLKLSRLVKVAGLLVAGTVHSVSSARFESSTIKLYG